MADISAIISELHTKWNVPEARANEIAAALLEAGADSAVDRADTLDRIFARRMAIIGKLQASMGKGAR